MQERGRTQEGMVADITIFDADTVTDNATYAEGTAPTTGIPFVIVNGTVVVEDGRVLPDVFPEQPIRFPEEAEPRFEPLTVENWRGLYLTVPTGFHGLDREQLPERSEAPAPADTQFAAGDMTWFSRGPRISVPPESHSVFCPLHGQLEPAAQAAAHRSHEISRGRASD
jgi:hypothetical protein